MNTLFWGLSLALTLGVLLLLMMPLLRATGRTPAAMEEVRLAVFQQQLRDLEADLANGLLEASQFERARADLERGLLEDSRDSDAAESAPVASRSPSWVTALGLVVAVPALALFTYLEVGGGPATLQPDHQASTMDVPGEHELDRMLEDLRARMAEQPDPRGLALLARSLVALGRVEQALETYDQALAQGADRDPTVLAQYADLLATATGTLEGRPLELVGKALELDPDHAQSLWLAGTAAYQEQDFRAAQTHWQRLLTVLPEDSEGAVIIGQELLELERLLAGNG